MTLLRAIVFDLDDTLYPEREFVFSGYRAVADAFGRQLAAPFDLFERMQQLFDTPDRGRVFDVIAAECRHPDPAALVPAMIDAYRSHAPAIALHADAERALARIAGHYRLGIITDGPLQMQANKIKALSLEGRVDEIILTDAWGRQFWKPHPRAFEEMASRLQASPTECLYVADNPTKDFVAANALGWHTLQVRRPDGIYADRMSADAGEPGAVIDTLDVIEPGARHSRGRAE